MLMLLIGVSTFWGFGGQERNSARGDAARKRNDHAGRSGDEGFSSQWDYVGRSRVRPEGGNLGVFVEGHHVDDVYTLVGEDDLHVSGCFSSVDVQRDQVNSLLSAATPCEICFAAPLI